MSSERALNHDALQVSNEQFQEKSFNKSSKYDFRYQEKKLLFLNIKSGLLVLNIMVQFPSNISVSVRMR